MKRHHLCPQERVINLIQWEDTEVWNCVHHTQYVLQAFPSSWGLYLVQITTRSLHGLLSPRPSYLSLTRPCHFYLWDVSVPLAPCHCHSLRPCHLWPFRHYCHSPPSMHSPLSCSTYRWPAWSCHSPIPEDSCLLPLTERTAHKELNTNVLLLPTFDCWCAEKWEFTALGQHNKSTVRRLKPEVAENLPSPSSSPSSDSPHTAQMPGDSSSHWEMTLAVSLSPDWWCDVTLPPGREDSIATILPLPCSGLNPPNFLSSTS